MARLPLVILCKFFVISNRYSMHTHPVILHYFTELWLCTKTPARFCNCLQNIECILGTEPFQGRSQDFLKGGSSTSIELLEAGVWGHSPQPLRDFQYFNKSKLSKLLYIMQKAGA